jgi:hypothetical protein
MAEMVTAVFSQRTPVFLTELKISIRNLLIAGIAPGF